MNTTHDEKQPITLPKPNEKQQECIDNINGKYLVLAGPGTGKTFTVTRRIRHMIQDIGVSPEKILCLTFSNTAAREMKTKIGYENVDVYTYHEFCLDIIKEFSDEFGDFNFKIITDSIKRNLIKECIDEINPKAYNNEKNNPYQYSQDILLGIDEIKKNRLSKETFFNNIEANPAWKKHLADLKILQQAKPTKERQKEIDRLETSVSRMCELWNFYELYCQKAQDLNYIDFFDMINMVLNKFEDNNSSLLEIVANRYEYILVDEYQDTNKAQNDIVFNLTEYCPNVFVVGDDDQIIYTFQGANLDTIENFLDKFKDVKVICLRENNRSTQTILDVSQELAKLQDEYPLFMADKSKTKKDKEFWANQNESLRVCSNPKFQNLSITKELISPKTSKVFDKNKPVEYYTFENEQEERDYIIHKIKTLLDSPDAPEKLSEIAVLTRKNDELKKYEVYLKANGIPVEITGGKNIFDISAVNVLVSYMQFLTNPEKYSDKLFSLLLLNPFKIDARDYKTLLDFKSHHRSLIENMNSLLNRGYSDIDIREKLEKILASGEDNLIESIKNVLSQKMTPVYNSAQIQEFMKTYEYLKNYIASENYANAILEIGNKTGVFSYYMSNEINRAENIKGINKLIDEANGYFSVHQNTEKTFSQFIEYLTTMIENDIKITLDKEEKPLNAIQLSTYHSSKGREFEYVFMPNLTSNKWESSSSGNKEIIPVSVPAGTTFEDTEKKQSQAKFLDNIKLLYVGMTRAKHTLVLSCQQTGGREGKLSWFIEKTILNPVVQDKNLISYPEKEAVSKIIIPQKEYDYRAEFGEMIKNKIPRTFSPSSLNLYRRCPMQYFYNKIMGINPDTGNKDNKSYGDAVHEAFRYAVEYAVANGEYPGVQEAYKVFESKIDSLPSTNPENLKQSARDYIFSDGKYYQKFTEISPAEHLNSKAEFELNFEEDGINFYGKIDRVDKNQDGTYTIYDYKTGTDSSGITRGGVHSDYYYQIAFYKYLFRKQFGIETEINTCFLYPLLEESSVFKDISDAECNEVAQEYIEIAHKIQNTEFEKPAKCPNEKFCNCKDVCRMKEYV